MRLDEQQGPPSQDFFRTPRVGRQAFLGLLETYLGLQGPDRPHAERVVLRDVVSEKYSEILCIEALKKWAALPIHAWVPMVSVGGDISKVRKVLAHFSSEFASRRHVLQRVFRQSMAPEISRE